MPMYVVRTKKMLAEQQRLSRFLEKRKGNRIDRIIHAVEDSYNLYSSSKNYINENGENIAPSKTKKKKKSNSIYPEGYFSATGKQKIRGKSKPPRI